MVGEGLDLIGRKPVITGSYDYTIMEGNGFPFGKMKIQGLGAFAENLLAEGIGGEEAIAAGVPVGGITWISRKVDDDDAKGVVLLFSVEHTPGSAGGPGAVACFPFARSEEHTSELQSP